METNLLSRKFLITLLVIILSFTLVLVKEINGSEWFKWAIGLVAVYTTGNVGQKILMPEEK